jgi:hypothetical protein
MYEVLGTWDDYGNMYIKFKGERYEDIGSFETNMFGQKNGKFSILPNNKILLMCSSGDEYAFVVRERPLNILQIKLGFDGDGKSIQLRRSY